MILLVILVLFPLSFDDKVLALDIPSSVASQSCTLLKKDAKCSSEKYKPTNYPTTSQHTQEIPGDKIYLLAFSRHSYQQPFFQIRKIRAFSMFFGTALYYR